MAVFVITSEYTRKIAHELDTERERWLNVRSGSFLDFLPADVVLLVPLDINHAHYLSDKVNLPKHYSDAVNDEKALQFYLSQLKNMSKTKNFRIHGKVVSYNEFCIHRELVLSQLRYSTSLAQRLKHQLKRQNIMRSNILNGDIANIEDKELPVEVEIIRNLVKIIRDENRKNPFLNEGDNSSLCLSRAQDYLTAKIEEYLWDVSDLYADDVVDMDNLKSQQKEKVSE